MVRAHCEEIEHSGGEVGVRTHQPYRVPGFVPVVEKEAHFAHGLQGAIADVDRVCAVSRNPSYDRCRIAGIVDLAQRLRVLISPLRRVGPIPIQPRVVGFLALDVAGICPNHTALDRNVRMSGQFVHLRSTHAQLIEITRQDVDFGPAQIHRWRVHRRGEMDRRRDYREHPLHPGAHQRGLFSELSRVQGSGVGAVITRGQR